MHAFLERNHCPECGALAGGIVRAGPNAREFGDPFDAQCTFFVLKGGVAELKAFIALVDLTQGHQRAAARALNQENLRIGWDRLGDNPHRQVQTSGVEGKITMARKEIPAASALALHKGRDGGNQIDKSKVIATIEGLLAQYKAGAVDVVSIETHEIAVAGKKRRARSILEVELPA